MDFEPQYTPEQEEFRQEVKAWMKENMPKGIVHPADPIDLTEEQYQKRREFGRRLGERVGSGPLPKPSMAVAGSTLTTPSSSKKRPTPLV